MPLGTAALPVAMENVETVSDALDRPVPLVGQAIPPLSQVVEEFLPLDEGNPLEPPIVEPVSRSHPFLSLERANKTPLQGGLLGGTEGLVPSSANSAKPRNSAESRDPSEPDYRLAAAEPAPDSKPAPEPAAPPRPASKPLTDDEQDLKNRVRRVTAWYGKPRLNTRDHCPWEILHEIIANGTTTQVLMGGPAGQPITAIGWLCFNRPAHGQQLLYLKNGQIGIKQGPGVQGHEGQFLAALAQARVMRDYPVRIGSQEYTVEDLVQQEQRTCFSDCELTFKLIGINHYVEPEVTWRNHRGEAWNIERLVREELAQPIWGATCGGTHRLVAMHLAVQKRKKHGLPIEGDFARAEQAVMRHQQFTFQLQNRDGSFSTEWFRGPGNNPDLERRLRTSGHLLEWILMTLPKEQLRHPNVQRGVAYVANFLWETRYQKWNAGYLCHAIHAMNLYDQQVFQPLEEQDQNEVVADNPQARLQ